MRVLETIVSILLVIIVFVIVPELKTKMYVREKQETWNITTAKQWIAEMQQSRTLTKEMYDRYIRFFTENGYDKVQIMEYMYEVARDGSKHLYQITTKEIEDMLETDGIYYFEQGHFIEVQITALGNPMMFLFPSFYPSHYILQFGQIAS